jgi:hypothetical protein
VEKAPMAEWSKAVDLRPTIVRCEGSNPSGCNLKNLINIKKNNKKHKKIPAIIIGGKGIITATQTKMKSTMKVLAKKVKRTMTATHIQ